MSKNHNNNQNKQLSFFNQMASFNQQQEGQSMINMFSPRNIMKYISTSIDQYGTKAKTYKLFAENEQQLLNSFNPYLQKIQRQYKKYKHLQKQHLLKSSSKQNDQKHEQIQIKLRLDKIPKMYFDQKFSINFSEKLNKLSLKRKQQQVTQYLDDIQILLYNKTAKNPQQYFRCIQNIDQTSRLIMQSYTKVSLYRKAYKQTIFQKNKRQLKILLLARKKQLIQSMISQLQMIKKISNIKSLSESNTIKQGQLVKLEILESVKKKQIDVCASVHSLSKIVQNLEFYRDTIKLQIYHDFNKLIADLMSKLLSYDKQKWKASKVNAEMLNIENKTSKQSSYNILQQSRLNITILDQSYFAFSETNQIPNAFQYKQQCITCQDQTISSIKQKIMPIWSQIVKYDLYDQVQVNQLIMRDLIRHNVMFNKDLDQYLTKLIEQYEGKNQPMISILQQDIEKEEDSKDLSSNQQNSQQLSTQSKNNSNQLTKKTIYQTALSGLGQFKDFKDLNKLTKKTINTFKRFGKGKQPIQTVISDVKKGQQAYCRAKQSQVHTKQAKKVISTQQKLSKIDIKFFLKAVKFYYDILTHFIRFVKQNQELTFFHNFIQKVYLFIQSRVKFFFSLRNITQKTSVQDFLLYLTLIEYWIDVCEEVYDNLGELKKQIIDDYLTALQKGVLVSELKESIQKSSFTSISIPSSEINCFYYIINWQKIQQNKLSSHNMSLTFIKQSQPQRIQQNYQHLFHQFKIIDRKIIYQKGEYFVCQSFLILFRQIYKYLLISQYLIQFNDNIQEKICQIVGFYVWYNLKIINKTGNNVKSKTLKNLCIIHSTISFLKLVFTKQLSIKNPKLQKTLSQFGQFFTQIQKNLTMTPFLLLQQQISNIYQNNSISSQFQIPSKQTIRILQIIKICLDELKIYFGRDKIVGFFQPSIKIIYKNYFGYLASMGKRGLLEIKEFLPKYKDLLLNYGFRQHQSQTQYQNHSQQQQKQHNLPYSQQHKQQQQRCRQQQKQRYPQQQYTHIFLTHINQMQRNFKSKISQIK